MLGMRKSAAWLWLGWLLVSMSISAGAAAIPPPVQETFTAAGKPIRVETYLPPGPARHPAVILLHGADGLEAHALSYRSSAEQLAAHGYVALLIHYFDATGAHSASEEAIPRDFLKWMEVAGSAVSFARSKVSVEPDSVGLLGFSLGASLALSLASQDERIAAVAEFYGTLPELAAALARRMPPVLILHGAQDRIVPVEQARRLEQILRSKGVPFEIKLYPGQGHGFTGDAAADAAARTLTFFAEHLKS